MMQSELEFGDAGIAEAVESKATIDAKRRRRRICCCLSLAFLFAVAGGVTWFFGDIKDLIMGFSVGGDDGSPIDVAPSETEDDDRPLPEHPFELDDDNAEDEGHSWDDDNILDGLEKEEPLEDDDETAIDDDLVDDDEVMDDDDANVDDEVADDDDTDDEVADGDGTDNGETVDDNGNVEAGEGEESNPPEEPGSGEETPPDGEGQQPVDEESDGSEQEPAGEDNPPEEGTTESPEGGDGDEGETQGETETIDNGGEEPEPADDGEEVPSGGDESNTPTGDGDGEEAPDDGEETETPTGDGEETPSDGEGEETSEGEETPADGEEADSPADGGEGEETPTDGEDTDSPADGGEGEETPTDGGEIDSPADGDEGEETPTDGEETDSFADGGEGEETPTDTEEPNTPADDGEGEETPTDAEETNTPTDDGGEHASWMRSIVTKDDGVKFEVLREFPHDEEAFTQGLTYHDGTLYESTGLNGGSSVRILNTETGDVEKKISLEHKYFGEGMTFYKDKLVQITWKLHTGFVYDIANLDAPPTQFKFDSVNGEGWGITYDDTRDEFIVSDGSPFLLVWKPDCIVDGGHCGIERKIQVTRFNGDRGGNINELEFWRGRVLANVWFENVLLVIHPETGQVEKEYAFETSDIFPKKNAKANVFNGISVTDNPETLFVTGKKWNTMFEVRLMEGKTPEQYEKDKSEAKAKAEAEAAIVPEKTPEEIQAELEHEWVVTPVSKEHGKMYEIVKQYDHDAGAFTQGLTYYDEEVYESTGLNGESSVRVVDLLTGTVERSTMMDAQYFGEGMAYINDKLVQLTWKSGKGFVYNPENLAEPPQEFTYNTTNGEGWGITYDPEENQIYVSDGSEYICVWEGDCFESGHCGMIRTVPTYRIGGEPAMKINELEYWRGRILANIWYEDVIAVINPTYGSFEKEYDMKDLWPEAERKKAGADVLNGISVAEDPNTLLVTGKKWDRLFEIKLLLPEYDDEERM